jgi:hypothetical protein
MIQLFYERYVYSIVFLDFLLQGKFVVFIYLARYKVGVLGPVLDRIEREVFAYMVVSSYDVLTHNRENIICP